MVGSIVNGNVELYNKTQKSNYISEMMESGNISEETSKSYLRIFLVTHEKEKELDKDLCQFTFEEMESVLYGFEANNRNTIESYARIISSYLKWAIGKNYIKKNVLAVLKPDDFQRYLTNKEIYFKNTQLQRYEDLCENYQDAVIIRMLFEGVGGKQFSEIRNLKKEDVDFERSTLRLISTLKADTNGVPIKYTERNLRVSDRLMSLIRGAIDQKTYMKKNGELNQTDNNNIRPYTDLVDNDYVVRPSITKTEHWLHPVDKYVIYRRIAIISESLDIENLTAKFIQRSGMIYQAHLLMEDNEVSLDDLKIVSEIFNVKSYHNLKGFLTTENVLKTYPQK